MSNCPESCDKLIETLEQKCQKLAREKGDMRIEIQKLKRELEHFETGHQGACPSCERVGELNVELSENKDKLEDMLTECSHNYWKEVEKRKDIQKKLDESHQEIAKIVAGLETDAIEIKVRSDQLKRLINVRCSQTENKEEL